MPERVALSARGCGDAEGHGRAARGGERGCVMMHLRQPLVIPANRPGINQIWTAIESKRVDLIVAEGSSRLYRHPTKPGELFEAAVDAGVRRSATP
jgi:hypothetical protein